MPQTVKSQSKFRQWINRDDGKHFQVGNQDIGALTIAGALIWICGLLLFQLQSKDLIPAGWALATAIVGFVIFAFGFVRDSPQSGT